MRVCPSMVKVGIYLGSYKLRCRILVLEAFISMLLSLAQREMSSSAVWKKTIRERSVVADSTQSQIICIFYDLRYNNFLLLRKYHIIDRSIHWNYSDSVLLLMLKGLILVCFVHPSKPHNIILV